MGDALALLRSFHRHKRSPALEFVVVEQPRGERARIEFDRATGFFLPSQYIALTFTSRFPGIYGWIAGTGMPPELHFDCLVFTETAAAPGEIVECRICGVYLRRDGDHKFVGLGQDVLSSLPAPDLVCLPDDLRQALERFYPDAYAGEGWRARAEALELLHGQPTRGVSAE